MELQRPDQKQLDYIHALYLRAFPLAERKPFARILQMWERGQCDVYCVVDEGRPCGLATVILHEDTALLDYFAIDEAERGRGLGGQALDALCRIYQKHFFFLEIESLEAGVDNLAQRQDRKAFYLHHGFVECGISIRIFGVNMEILAYGRPITWARCKGVYRSIYPIWTYWRRIRVLK